MWCKNWRARCGYDTFLQVTIQGAGITGLAEAEPETGGQFKLGQNFPNPYLETTTVPFSLANDAEVQLDLFNLAGRHVGVLKAGHLPAGDHQLEVNLQKLGLPTGNYVYQLQVSNSAGVFRQGKLMTAMP